MKTYDDIPEYFIHEPQDDCWICDKKIPKDTGWARTCSGECNLELYKIEH